MPANARFALFPNADEQPTVFGGRAALAKAIHKARAGAGIELADARLHIQGAAAELRVVSVYLQDAGGSRAGFLGYAYLAGAGRLTLQAALDAEAHSQPTGVNFVEAA